MNRDELHSAIRLGGDNAPGKWARAVLSYYDDEGELIEQCLVKPISPASTQPASDPSPL